jgi:iron complex transport system substrate-binding protein
LGRAEWIKFIAAFYNKEALADSLFAVTVKSYLNLKALVKTVRSKRPLVLSGDNFRGTWYQPGGKSYTARLFTDAGGNYLYKKDSSRGSIPMSFEQVFKDLKDADVWVGATNGNTLHELVAQDPRYRLFSAFKNGQVYAYTNRSTVEGGNDFWESAVARPDSLLADFMYLFHPELLPGHQWVYLEKLH